MKFNKGQLVEIIKVKKRTELIGERFKIDKEYIGTGKKTEKGKIYYYLPDSLCSEIRRVVSNEFLKAVNPDNDEQSEFTFKELMSDLTKSNQLTHNTKQG